MRQLKQRGAAVHQHSLSPEEVPVMRDTSHAQRADRNVSVEWKFFTVFNTCEAKINSGGTTATTVETTSLIRHLKHRYPANVSGSRSSEPSGFQRCQTLDENL